MRLIRILCAPPASQILNGFSTRVGEIARARGFIWVIRFTRESWGGCSTRLKRIEIDDPG
jgi:hypothetical protein